MASPSHFTLSIRRADWRLASKATGNEKRAVGERRVEIFVWWRWRRVELLVQSVQPETNYERVR